VKDLQQLGGRYQTLIRVQKAVPTPLKANDVISLAGSVVLGVEEFGEQITLRSIDETK